MIFFWIKEAVKLIGRAKSSSLLSLISMSISVFLIAVSIITIKLSSEFQNNLKRNVNINVFLVDSLSNNSIAKIESKLKQKDYIGTITYIDKKQAANNFVKQTGEDFRQLLDYNPLPASFLVTLKENYVNKDSLNAVTANISSITGVDEVVFQQQFVYTLLSYISKVQKYILIATAVLFLISLYLVYSTVKLIMRSKYEEMETMKLVGAKLSTIKMPIILKGFIIGFFASIISIALFVIIVKYTGAYDYLHHLINFKDDLVVIFMLCLGPLVGIVISALSLRRISLKV
jgi:cell division transport system permease protein